MKKKLVYGIAVFFTAMLLVLVGCEQPGTDTIIITEAEAEPEPQTQLVIKNQSFTDLEEVIWNGIVFSNNEISKVLEISARVSETVTEGSGYIFFKRKSSPIIARTQDVVFVEKGKTQEFTFIDNTPIVESNNDTNTGTLKDLQSTALTIVFSDDAEGEMQAYHERSHFAGYYSTEDDLPQESRNERYVHPPKEGNYSIAIGHTNSSALHLKIDLERDATLSFWVANSGRSSSDNLAYFTVNGVRKATFPKGGWSYREFELESGETNLIWGNPDGLHETSSAWYDEYSQYLSLDNILITYKPQTKPVQLVIKNQSFTDLEEVKWNNIVFSNNEIEDIMRMDTSVSKDVSEGADYIYFKRTTSPIFARTQDVITLEEGKPIEFTFTDDTLVVDTENPSNTGTLRSITLPQKTITFDSNSNNSIPNPDPITVAHGETIQNLPNLGEGFGGWFFSEDEITLTEFTSSTPVTENLTVTAKWLAKYTVNFKSNDSDVANPSSIDVWKGDTISVLPVVEKQYHTFLGWFFSNGDEFTTATIVDSSVTVFGKWVFGTTPAPSLKKTASAIELRWTPPLGITVAVVWRVDNDGDFYKLAIIQNKDEAPMSDEELLFSDFYTDNETNYTYYVENQTYDNDSKSWSYVVTNKTKPVVGVYQDNGWLNGANPKVSYNSSTGVLSFSPKLPIPLDHASMGSGKILLEFDDIVTIHEVVLEGPLSSVNLKNIAKLSPNIAYEIFYVPIYYKEWAGLKQYYYVGTDIRLTGKTTGIVVPK